MRGNSGTSSAMIDNKWRCANAYLGTGRARSREREGFTNQLSNVVLFEKYDDIFIGFAVFH